MPLRNRVAFAETGLTVAYRASTEPQILEIRARCRTRPGTSMAALLFRELVKATRNGAGGGAEFAPGQVRFEHLSGPIADGDPEAAGPEWAWRAEVACVSPRYIRNIVEHLSLCGSGGPLLDGLTIAGELGLDDTAMSVRERDVVAWLADPLAWPGVWSTPGFAIKDIASSKGVKLRLKMGGPITPELEQRVTTELLDSWGSEIAVYVGTDGLGGRKAARPTLTVNQATFAMHYKLFTYEPKPTRDMLVRFHEDVCPIVEAELGFGPLPTSYADSVG